MPGRDQHGHRLLFLLDSKVDLSGQPASGATKSVVRRLRNDAAGRFLL